MEKENNYNLNNLESLEAEAILFNFSEERMGS